MSGYEEVWAELGIEPTKEIRTIKKAYARQIAKYHPEEYPEEFQKLHEAYEAALEQAKATGKEELPGPDAAQEAPDFSEGAKISEMAEKYAREQEKKRIRRRLYGYFLCNRALAEFDKFTKVKGYQSHKDWGDYLTHPLFLEAVHNEEFLLRLVRRMEKLKFRLKTIKMVKEVIFKEAPEELEQLEEVKKYLTQSGPKKSRNAYLKIGLAALAVIVTAVMLILTERDIEVENQREAEEEEYRSLENIEAYINEKYQTDCKVEESSITGLYHLMPGILTQEDPDKYYEVDTKGQEGMPESFRLSWDKESTDYDDIQDNLIYETVSKYAKDYGLSLDYMKTPLSAVQAFDMTMDELWPKVMDFFRELKKSRAVQTEGEITVTVQPGSAYNPYMTVTVKKDEALDEGKIRTELEECYQKTIDITGGTETGSAL